MPNDHAPPGPVSDPRVHCPRCGKRFRVDTAGLTDERVGASARCSGCATPFRVRRDTAGGVEVFVRDARAPEPTGGSAGDVSLVTLPPSRGVLASGERIGRYEVEDLLVRGGMGAVYRAFDSAANRHVAIKVLPAGAVADDRRRFRREVEVQGNIQHSNIMAILDSGNLDGAGYYTMELLRQPLSLSEIVAMSRSGEAAKDPYIRPLATLPGLIRHVMLPVCQAIHHANMREGVLHRDLKPGNVLVDRHGLRPLVIDFGVCSLLERKNRRLAHLPPNIPQRGADGVLRVTGTLVYMPPEQARGMVDRRGDIWALGALLHHSVTGAPPLAPYARGGVPAKARAEGLRLLADKARREGNTEQEAGYQKSLEALEAGRERTMSDLQRDVLAARYEPRPATLSRGLEAIIARAMSRAPEQRYRHALELHDDLVSWLEGHPVRALMHKQRAVRRNLYRAGLFLRRHRKAAVLLLGAAAIGAWAAVGLFGGSNGAPPGTTPDAAAIRRDVVEDTYLPRARTLGSDAVLAFGEGRWAQGRAQLASLSELFHNDLLGVLEGEGTPEQRAEIEDLRALALGQRRVEAPTTQHTTDIFQAVPIDEATGCVDWERGQRLDDGGTPLAFGRWLVGIDGVRQVWMPVSVTPGDRALAIVLPADTRAIPEGRAWVDGGRVRGPLGTSDVPTLLWDLTEVTNARYEAFLATLPAEERAGRVPRARGSARRPARVLWRAKGDGFVPPSGSARRPVEGISLADAGAFAVFAGGRLPSAQEWAWAATGGLKTLCPVGAARALLALRIAKPDLGAADAGSTSGDRSPFGLLDMAGNLAEFTTTHTTWRGTSGYLVMGGGYATGLGRAFVTEALPVGLDEPLKGVGFRLVYEVKK